MSNLTTATGVQSFMRQAISETDWNDRADQVKAANGGYPGFWFPAIIASGLLGEVSAKF